MKQLSLFVVLATASVASAQNAKDQTVKRVLPSGPAPVIFAPAPLVGGTDTCTTPDVLVGAGPHAFDNSLATTGTEGQTETVCLAFGSTAVTRDVWFTWNAPTTGSVYLTACGTTVVDTKIAVYGGLTCPTAGSALACNDDNCPVNFESATAPFAVTAGQDYVFQVGTYPFPAGVGAAGGTGTFQIVTVVLPTNDDCTTPIALAGPGSYPFDESFATTGTQGQTESICNFSGSVTVENDLWYTYAPTTTGTATFTTCGLTSPSSSSDDTKVAIYSGTACPAAGSAIACNDDDATCGGLGTLESTVTWPTTCGVTNLIQLGQYFGGDLISGTFNVSETGTACATPFTSYCFGDGTGTACPCANSGIAGNGCANGINPNGANLTATGNASIAGDTWQLAASGVTNGPGLYFQGTVQLNGGNGNVFGDGLRCVGGAIIRLGIVTGVANASTYPSPNPPAVNAIPVSIKGLNVAGNVRNYQLWYRDSTAGFCTTAVFNLTNAINVTWQP